MARIDFRRPLVWVPAVLGALVLVLVVIRIVESRNPEPPPATIEEIRGETGIPVRVARVEGGDLEVWRTFHGTVSGVRDAVITARTDDPVLAVPVSVGERVRQGEVVVRQAGEATRARARQARSAYEQAKRTVDRLRPLYEAGAISEQQMDEALTRLELAEADLAAAQDVLALTSPLTGTVTEVMARVGMIPTPGDPLVRVADLSQLVVRVPVSARQAAEIREGQPARVEGLAASGEVRRVALQADPETRLVEVEVGFPPGSGLIPGTLASIAIRTQSAGDVLQMPASAVQEGAVWVVQEDGTVQRTPVRVGIESADRVQILSGLEAGDRVVVEGGSLLTEGARVRMVDGGTAGDDV